MLATDRRAAFGGWKLPAALIAPQLLLTCVFFLWPAGQAILASLTQQDPFGLSARFVGLDNFTTLFADPLYRACILRTLAFAACVCACAMATALLLAVFADRDIRGRALYRTLLIWPYAVAPATAAVIWVLLLHPQVGVIGHFLNVLHLGWNYQLDSAQAFAMIVLASAWKQISYNFIFLVAGLQSIPESITEAARMDGARGWRRFRTITLPLLMPTIMFLLAVNLVYAAFDTFAVIQALTQGGPGQATETLVVKVYRDGVVNLDLGSSSAQSVVLMAGVILLVAVQFRAAGRRTRA